MNKEHLIPPVLHKTRTTTEFIMYYIIAGSLSLIENGHEIYLKDGEIYFFNKNEFHKPCFSTDCEYYYLHFDGNFTLEDFDNTQIKRKLENISFRTLNTNIYGKTSVEENTLILPKQFKIESAATSKKIISLFEAGKLSKDTFKKPYFKIISSIKTCEIFIEIYREFSKSHLNQPSRFGAEHLTRITNYLQKNSSSHITGEDISREFGYSFDYINKCFKAAIGKTVFNYLAEIRINNAALMLEINEANISSIAEKCGFCDLYYFSRTFKQKTGLTPSEYINKKHSGN